MIEVDKNNDIKMSRGETTLLNVPLYNKTDHTKYTMKSTDKLYLALKNNIHDTNAVMMVSSNAGVNVIPFVSEDTLSLEPGIYTYDILLKTSDSAGNAMYTYITEARIFDLLPTVVNIADIE